MNYTENFEGIKLDIQAVDLTISDELQEDIRQMIKRLQKHISEINWVDAYFKMESTQSTDVRMLSVRLGIPGRDVFASEKGYYWQALLKHVEIKLRRQLRRKLVLR